MSFRNFLACGLAALTLGTATMVNATTAHRSTLPAPIDQLLAQNNLSASDRQAIQKTITEMYRAINNGDIKQIIKYYSPRYTYQGQGINDPGFKTSLRMAVAMVKAYGMTLSARNFQITSGGKNQATVIFDGQVELSADMQAEVSPEERQKLSKVIGRETVIMEKINGRWLIAASGKDVSSSARPSNGTRAAASAQPTPQAQKAMRLLFTKHLQALNQENLPAYLATLDSRSPQYKEAQAQTPQLFKDYDLKYELQSLEVVSFGDSEGVVKMVATVKKLRGGAFRDSKMVTYNTVRKGQGGWQIYDTQIESLDALRANR